MDKLNFLTAGIPSIAKDYGDAFNKLDEIKNDKANLLKLKKNLENYHYDNESILNRYYEIFKGE